MNFRELITEIREARRFVRQCTEGSPAQNVGEGWLQDLRDELRRRLKLFYRGR